MNNEVKNRIVQAAIGKMRDNPANQPRSPHEALIEQAKQITLSVRELIKPILAAGGWKDKEALRQVVASSYLHNFSTMSKDEL